MSDLELQQYLFDLQGYLVIENVLTPTEVVTLNQLIDQQHLPTPDKQIRFGHAGGGAPAGPGFLDWGQPFCNLLDHMEIMPMLRLRLGDCFRLDPTASKCAKVCPGGTYTLITVQLRLPASLNLENTITLV